MTKKSEKLEIYMTEQKKQAIKTAAAEADMSVSSWLREAADRRLRAEQQDELLTATEAEQRIERLIAQATDEIEAAASGLHEMQAKTGVYTIANFRLLSTGFSDGMVSDSLSYGSERLRADLADLGLDAPDVDTTSSTADESDTTDKDGTTGLFDDG
jgi:hypothetical protein